MKRHGVCPTCKRTYRLNQDGMVRYHGSLHKTWLICPGSYKRPAQEVAQ